jgi:putative DNA primase/helicase
MEQTAAEYIASILGGVPVPSGQLVHCPVPSHGRGRGDEHPSLLVRAEPWGLHVHCFAKCSREDVLTELGRRGLLPNPGQLPKRPAIIRSGDTVTLAMALWREARSPEFTLVDDYLSGRRLVLDPEVLWVVRYHPSLWFKQEQRTRPGLLALLTDVSSGEPCGIIRTFLNPDFVSRKHYDPRCKLGRRMLGRAKHAAVKLGSSPNPSKLVIGEGTESCLAAWMMHLRPIWALGSAVGVAAFPLLPFVEQLIILRENDKVGREAADTCADRWLRAGRRVLFAPVPQGKDHNDMLMMRAK